MLLMGEVKVEMYLGIEGGGGCGKTPIVLLIKLIQARPVEIEGGITSIKQMVPPVTLNSVLIERRTGRFGESMKLPLKSQSN